MDILKAIRICRAISLVGLGGLCLSFPFGARAQSGDKAGEMQKSVVPSELIPPAPLLSPEQQLKTFQLPLGFRAELVAAEPLVTTPVQVQFDHQGRLWVIEMNSYMPDSQGHGEREPRGDVVILTDTDGDGRMDRRTVFAEHLVMPRSLMLYGDGAVVAVPPKLVWFRDTDGDGKADLQTILATDFATEDDFEKQGEKANPEHASNSPTWTLENVIYAANHRSRYRILADGTWRAEPAVFRGQWGLSQDDFGRLFYDSNSDWLRGDFIPDHYLSRNPNLRGAVGVDAQLIADQRVWPGRVTPAVNRGYQPGALNPNGRLAKCTAACGPVVYRGDQFPAEFKGDVFVCEPSANLIRRFKLTDTDGVVSARNAYDEAEFLTSTDERFRPVNLANGPDGALYVVDIARGLIQHRIYLTSYLRHQLESRALMTPVDCGRIYRIVHEGRPARRESLEPKPTIAELVTHLQHPSGFWRDRAQQLLVERRDRSVAEPLRKLVLDVAGTTALGRLHGLWTLDGLGLSDLGVLTAAMQDSNSQVRMAALRQLEALFVGPQRDAALDLLYRRAGWFQGVEQIQLLLTAGQLRSAQSDLIMKSVLMGGPASRLRFDAAISGLEGHELEFLEALVNDPICSPDRADHAPLVSGLARAITYERKAPRLDRLLILANVLKAGSWAQLAILDGIATTLPPPAKGAGQESGPKVKPVFFAAEPTAWKSLLAQDLEAVKGKVMLLGPLWAWPGHNDEVLAAVVPLTSMEAASFDRGKELYTTVCGACHQPHGNGQEGQAPPLHDSEWALGSEQRIIRVVLHGARDAFTIKGQKWELAMPAFGEALENQQIADVLTYIRREWGHTAAPVTTNAVAAIRASEAKREDAWTEPELLKIK